MLRTSLGFSRTLALLICDYSGTAPCAAAPKASQKRVRAWPAGFATVLLWLGFLLLAPGLSAQTITATIPAGAGSVSEAINTATNMVYVANGDNTVTVIDGATDTVVATVPVASGPVAMAVNPLTNKIYVTTVGLGYDLSVNGLGALVVIDGTTNTVAATITVGSNPAAVVVSPLTNTVYVLNQCGADPNCTTPSLGSVSVISGANNAVTATVAVGNSPGSMALNPVTNTIFVVNSNTSSASPVSTVSVINGANNTVTAAVATGGYEAGGIAVNPVTNMVYVPMAQTNGSGAVAVINGANNTASTVAVGNTPRGVAVNAVTNTIFVTNYNDNTVSVINGLTNTVVATVPVGGIAIEVEVDPVTNMAFVNANSNVSAISGATNTVTATLTINVGAEIAINPVTNKVYVTVDHSDDDSEMVVIDESPNSGTTVATDPAPYAVALNPATNQIYVSNGGGACLGKGVTGTTVDVIDGTTNTRTASVGVGTAPCSLAVNPVTNTIYVANYSTNNVSVIDGVTNDVTATVAVGTNPDAIAVNPLTNKIYVADFTSNAVTVIDGATNTTTPVALVSGPLVIAVNPVTNLIYASGGLADQEGIAVIDGATNSIITVIGCGFDPVSIGVNPVTNMIYITEFTAGAICVIDGATNSFTEVVTENPPTGVREPWGLTVNPITNMVYVANCGSCIGAGQPDTVGVISGATHNNAASFVTSVTVGEAPYSIAVDQATNKVYVGNCGNFCANSGTGGASMTVIDGASNTVEAAAATGDGPWAILPNLATHTVYEADQPGNDVTVFTPNVVANIPLSAAVQGVVDSQTVSGQAIFATTNPNPSFTVTVTSSYTPIAPAPTAVYYQLDTEQGAWQFATGPTSAGGNQWTFPAFQLSNVLAGVHILYVYPAYGDEAALTNGSGYNSSAEIGNVTAYVFAEFQPPTTPTSVGVTSSASPSTYGESITFTASVSPASSPAPSGTISFYAGNSLLGSAAVSSGTASFTGTNLPAGTYSISASYSGDGHYGASIGAPISQTVSPAALAVTASSASMTSGGTIPAITYSMTGFVNGDTQSSATSGAPTLTTTAAAQPKPGIYATTPAIGTLAAANYTFAFVNGVLSVNASMNATTGQSATIPFVLGVGATDTASPITFSCAGLPSGSQCAFSPSSVPAPVTAPVTVTLSISTSSAASVPYRAPRFPWTLALAVPVMLLFPAVTALRRRRMAWLLATAAVVVGLAIAGCSSTKTVTNTVTDSYLSISAVDASGNVLGSFNVQLNVGP